MRTGEFVQTSSELAEFAPELAEFAREFVQSSLERYSVHPDDSSSRFYRLRIIDFQFLQFCRCPRAKKMKLNDTFECMFSLTLILANEGI